MLIKLEELLMIKKEKLRKALRILIKYYHQILIILMHNKQEALHLIKGEIFHQLQKTIKLHLKKMFIKNQNHHLNELKSLQRIKNQPMTIMNIIIVKVVLIIVQKILCPVIALKIKIIVKKIKIHYFHLKWINFDQNPDHQILLIKLLSIQHQVNSLIQMINIQQGLHMLIIQIHTQLINQQINIILKVKVQGQKGII